MAFTALIPSQIGKEWSQLPASYVWFYPETIVVSWEFDAMGNPVQPHMLFMHVECCVNDSLDSEVLFLYLQLYRKVRRRWELVPFTTITTVLGGDSVPSDVSFFEHYPNRLQNCIGYQPPGCGPLLPINTRLGFVDFNSQISAWVASAEQVYGIPPDNLIYDPDFEGCAIDFCENRDPGWYVTFSIDPMSVLGETLTLLGSEFDPKTTLKISDPIFDSNGFETSIVTEFILEQVVAEIASWLIEKGVQAIALRTGNPFLLALTFLGSAALDSISYDIEFCPGENRDPFPIPSVCEDCESDPVLQFDPWARPSPRPTTPSGWDDYRLCYTIKQTVTNGVLGGYTPCPPPCPLGYLGWTGQTTEQVTYISGSLIVRVPEGARPPKGSPTIVTSYVTRSQGVGKLLFGYWNLPIPDGFSVAIPDITFNDGVASYDPKFTGNIFFTGESLMIRKICDAPWFGCEPILVTTGNDIKLEMMSWYYSRDFSSCVAAEPKSCTATILLRRMAVGFNPLSTFKELFGAGPGDLVTIQLPVDSCPINPELYATGLSPGADGTWFLDVGVPTTGIVEINTGSGTYTAAGAPAGIIPLPSSVKTPAPGIPGQLVDTIVTWALVDVICTCE